MIVIKDGFLIFKFDKHGKPKKWLDLRVFGNRILQIALIIAILISFKLWRDWSNGYVSEAFGQYEEIKKDLAATKSN